MTTGEAAKKLGWPVWAIRRVYDRGLLPQPERVGQYRVIPESDLPAVKAALERAGYLKVQASKRTRKGQV